MFEAWLLRGFDRAQRNVHNMAAMPTSELVLLLTKE